MHKIVGRATGAALDDSIEATPIYFRQEGDYLFKEDVIGDPDGESFRRIAGEAGRPDLQERAELLYQTIGQDLDAIDAEFAAEAGEGFRARIPEARVLESRIDEGSRSRGGREGVAGQGDPAQLDLFDRRGPGRNADRSTTLARVAGSNLQVRTARIAFRSRLSSRLFDTLTAPIEPS